MTLLDPPAAAARRQWVLDRWVELLVAWGCPLDGADARARELLDVALASGYALPVVLQGTTPRGGGSTEHGRALARVIALHTRAGCRCDPLPARALDPAQHPIGCPVRTAHDAATGQGREGVQQPAGQDRQAVGTIGTPPGLRHGVTRDETTAP